MGTRNLTCVVKDKEYKVAQYGQWDGYPEGQGFNILNFLKGEFDRELFEEKLKDVSWISKEEIENRWIEMGAQKGNPLVSMDISNNFAKKYPENSRDTGSNILRIIQNANYEIKLQNSIGFAADSLFCEWAYVIDLDKDTLEVYKGFNEEPLNEDERFFFLQTEENEFYPITLVSTFDLNNLPYPDEFLEKIKEEIKEELA